jgi:hypothetical protein
MIIRAVIKTKKSSPQVKFQLESSDQLQLQPQIQASVQVQQQVQQQTQPQVQALPQAQIPAFTQTPSTLTYPQPHEPTIQPSQPPSFQRSASLNQPQIQVPQASIAQSQQYQNIQKDTCSYCGNYIQYYSDYNAYWCETCQAYTDPRT